MTQAATAAQPVSRYGFESPEAEEFPPIVIIENTTVCNLRCIHCPQGQGYPERDDYHAVWMDWEVYKKAIDEIAQNKITLLRFAAAGEPIIHPQFLDQIRYAKEKGISPVNLTTNGLTLDNPAIEYGKKIPGKTTLERLLEIGIDVIDISLDAWSRDRYEKIRVWSNYHRVWSNVHRILYLRQRMKAKTKLMLSIIDQPESRDEVDQFVKYWSPLVDRVIVRSYQTNLGLTPQKPGSVIETLAGVPRWPCPQFWKRVSIKAEGYILFCVVDWLGKSKLGDLRTTTIKEVWKSEQYNEYRKAHLEGRWGEGHPICGPCVDWMAMRWDWGFEVAIDAIMHKKEVGMTPPPLVVPG